MTSQGEGPLPTLAEIEADTKLIYRFMQPTPQYRWPLLCERLGTEVWVKHEDQASSPSDSTSMLEVFARVLQAGR